MAKDIEELKFIVNLATDKGKMEQQNQQLSDEVSTFKQKEAEWLARDKQREAYIAQLEERIRQLEALGATLSGNALQADQNGSLQPKIVVNQYFLLSAPKTTDYVRSLDDDHRMFAGHMLSHTLADGTSTCTIDLVNQITQLGGTKRQEDLTDAIKEAVNKPTTEYFYGDKNEFKEDSKMLKIPLLPGMDPAEVAKKLTEEKEGDEDE